MQSAWSLIRRNGQRSWNFFLTHRSLPIAVTVLGIVGLVVVVNFAPSAVRPDGSEEYLGWGNWVFVPSLLLVAIGAAATILSFKTQESRAERIERLTKALDESMRIIGQITTEMAEGEARLRELEHQTALQEQLAKLSASEATAIREALKSELGRERRRSLFRDLALVVLGAALTYVVGRFT
jgi:hypothetical protein